MALGDDSSPLSPLFDGTPPAVKRRKRRARTLVAALAAAALIPTMSGAFASPITISSGDIEFGQGSAAASTCDPAITISIDSEYSPAPDNFFRIATLTLSHLNASEPDAQGLGCYGKDLIINAYEGTTKLDLNGSDEGDAITYTVGSPAADDQTRTLDVHGSVDASLVTRLTVETSDATAP
jgi:hypothetical protein